MSESLRNDVAEILMGLLGVDAETAHWLANGVTDGLRERYPGGRINAYLAEMTRSPDCVRKVFAKSKVHFLIYFFPLPSHSIHGNHTRGCVHDGG